MPVKGFIGLQRQGKTYSCMKYAVLPMLKTGRKVVTNIPVTPKALEEFPNLEYQKEIDYENLQAGALYAIDEIWNDCPKGLTTMKLPEKFKEFFAMSGHLVGDNGLTTEIIVITQNYETQICDYVLGQIERTYYVEKIKISDKLNKCSTKEYKGVVKGNPPRGKPEGATLEPYDSEIFEYYKSNSGAKDGQISIEMDAVKKKGLMDLKTIKYGIPIGIVVIILLIYFGSSMFDGVTNKKNLKEQKKHNYPTATGSRSIANRSSIVPQQIINPAKSKRQKEIIDFYDFTDEINTFPLAEDKRLTGQLNVFFPPNVVKNIWQLTIKNQYTIDVSANHVKQDIYGQYYMVYRGEIVTQYTGEKPFIYDDKYIPDGRSLENKESMAIANSEPVKEHQENNILLNQ